MSLDKDYRKSNVFESPLLQNDIKVLHNNYLRDILVMIIRETGFPKNLGRLWLAYTELQGDFYMLQFISVDSRHFAFSNTTRQ